MKFHFFHIITFLMLLLVATNAETLPMTKVITNLLLPSSDGGVKKDYYDGGEARDKTDEISKKLPNGFRYHHAASELDVNSRDLLNGFRYHHAASKPDVNSRDLPNGFRYHHTASESGVNSGDLLNGFRYHHAASQPDVNSGDLPNGFRYHHAASEPDVNFGDLSNGFRYHHAGSKPDVNSGDLSNGFPYHHAASKPDVNSGDLSNGFPYHHAASKPDINSGDLPNGFRYHHAASKPNVNSRDLPNEFRYHHASSKPNVNSRDLHNTASETQLHDKPKATIFFFEKDLHHGTKSYFRFAKTNPNNEAKFLPREFANSIPFSSKKLEYILNKLNIRKGSKAARIVNNTITDCEVESIKGEEKLCVTSLESMIDFSISKIGKNLEAVSTEMYKESDFQQYTVITQGVKRLGENNKAVVCHKQNYPYAVFFCHTTDTTKIYSVPLEGVDGSRVKAIAVCHGDTSQWNPKHFAFLELKVKVGTAPICHLLPQDHVAWIAK
ncbi:BURP domain-containing protein 5-like isoform X1 [Vicia villosa]|uniref:BURP domain-containing protein 5-like isoform X1 n=1 Tax=Vicia villosa TaxID=3911 RepID=UPI00273AB007|nr:BURP domain-containing protein 5-like isoform X1 [Vicia villosa]